MIAALIPTDINKKYIIGIVVLLVIIFFAKWITGRRKTRKNNEAKAFNNLILTLKNDLIQENEAEKRQANLRQNMTDQIASNQILSSINNLRKYRHVSKGTHRHK